MKDTITKITITSLLLLTTPIPFITTIYSQPYPSIAYSLIHQYNCTEACVCFPTCPTKRCETINPSIPWNNGTGWGRFGFVNEEGESERPLHISDGTHSAGLEEAKRIVTRNNPLQLEPPRSYNDLTTEDIADLSLIWCSGNPKKSARAMLIQLYPIDENGNGSDNGNGSGNENGNGNGNDLCYPSWNCSPMPPHLLLAYEQSTSGYNFRQVRFSARDLPGCWKLLSSSTLGSTIFYAKGKEGCDPTLTVINPNPNPICGDGIKSPDENCDTCPADQSIGECDTLSDECISDSNTLCLNDNRFSASILWEDNQGNNGIGLTHPITSDTGAFTFFHPDNLEVIVKVLDGQIVNGYYWVFYASLTNVEFTLTIIDKVTGAIKVYRNEQGEMASQADTAAFRPTLDSTGRLETILYYED